MLKKKLNNEKSELLYVATATKKEATDIEIRCFCFFFTSYSAFSAGLLTKKMLRSRDTM